MTNTTKEIEIAKYQNGNTFVTLMSDGSKIREYEDTPFIVFPESIDVKITNYCDMGCSYCHESSTIKGLHGDLNKLLEVIEPLPRGVELAIGGGNPLSHPNLVEFLQILKDRGLIANITVNQGHLKTYQDLLLYLIKEDLVKGVGISIVNNNFNYIKPLLEVTNNIVYHVIAGVNEIEVINKLIPLSKECKVLILGYKVFGFGVQFYSDSTLSNLKHWYKSLYRYFNNCTLSFDNLAIEQLKVKRLLTKEAWNSFYMGDDFTYTMYIDAVNQEYAPTSRSKQRVSFHQNTLIEFFNKRKQ